jgi:hypothetical protein
MYVAFICTFKFFFWLSYLGLGVGAIPWLLCNPSSSSSSNLKNLNLNLKVAVTKGSGNLQQLQHIQHARHFPFTKTFSILGGTGRKREEAVSVFFDCLVVVAPSHGSS